MVTGFNLFKLEIKKRWKDSDQKSQLGMIRSKEVEIIFHNKARRAMPLSSLKVIFAMQSLAVMLAEHTHW